MRKEGSETTTFLTHFLTLLTGNQSYHEESLQVPRSVWELQHPNLLDAAGRLQRGGQLPEDEVRTREETGDGQEAGEGREQRGQQGSHSAHFPEHRSDGAHLLGGLPGLLRQEPEPGVPGHGGARVSEGQQEYVSVGAEELPQAVLRVRPQGGGEAHRGRQQLQLQIPLVLHGEVRQMHAGCYQILLRAERRREETAK